jgi:hypothetical protein
MYWCCAQVEPRRDRLASHCLTLAGYEIYQPLLREQRRSHGRKMIVMPPLFPGYLFLWVVSRWWNARWAAGVRRRVLVLLHLLGGQQRVRQRAAQFGLQALAKIVHKGIKVEFIN